MGHTGQLDGWTPPHLSHQFGEQSVTVLRPGPTAGDSFTDGVARWVDVIDLGGINTARATEMMVKIRLLVMTSLGTPNPLIQELPSRCSGQLGETVQRLAS